MLPPTRRAAPVRKKQRQRTGTVPQILRLFLRLLVSLTGARLTEAQKHRSDGGATELTHGIFVHGSSRVRKTGCVQQLSHPSNTRTSGEVLTSQKCTANERAEELKILLIIVGIDDNATGSHVASLTGRQSLPSISAPPSNSFNPCISQLDHAR